MKFFKRLGKIAKGVGKVALKATVVLKPIAGTAALIVPGGGALMAGINVAGKVVDGYNSVKPHKRKQAANIVAATRLVATQSKDPKVRQGAVNGLTLFKKIAAGKRAALRGQIDAKGFVRVA